MPRKTATEKQPVGHPPIFRTASDLHDAAEAYFLKVKDDGDPPTLSGIALELGYCDRQSLYDQAKRGDEFSCVIKKIRSRINAFHETRLAGDKPTGSIFFLKCHGGQDFREPAARHLVASKRVDDMTEEELVAFLGDGK